MFTDKRMILYRGSLKSCNYRCSYCPFSKHKGSDQERDRDREQWLRFVEHVWEKNMGLALEPGAIMVAPYGEALIHPWYWEGLGRLTSFPHIELAGAQTNLSFSIEESLKRYQRAGGRKGKLRLWATFHPEMTGEKEFADKCRRLLEEGVFLCAGAVGVPDNLERLQRLRDLLPEEIYLWVNKMDGWKRPYTEEEIKAFLAVDPYFYRELAPVKADPGQCGNRLFAEADGRQRVCNIGPVMNESWYDSCQGELRKQPECKRRQCSCYLAYGGRRDVMNQILFGPYPLFRIPRRPKAVFLDIQGTLIPKDKGAVPERVRQDLEALKGQGSRLFFATTLPLKDAARRCREIWPLFEGGIFSGGAHLVWKEDGKTKELVRLIKKRGLELLKKAAGRFHARLLSYETKGALYKITLVRSVRAPWTEEEKEDIAGVCRSLWGEEVRLLIEGRCLEITAAEAKKEEGVRFLCSRLNLAPQETAAAGDSPEDEAMIRVTLSISSHTVPAAFPHIF